MITLMYHYGLKISLLPNPLAKGSVTTPSVVGVKFVRRHQCDKIYMAKKLLKTLNNSLGQKIYINKDLPADSRNCMAHYARWLKTVIF